ncbi:MAG: TonB-dependent receptor [Candidatus Eremiobacteraeota bacterium]|nr:TonB-dependent receptor [Candidatus Eremiobacteraeota bacterium]
MAILLVLGLLCQETWALAGTTGGLSGNVLESGGTTPIANVKVTASSPSQTLSTQTDASGHFVFISLAPDTYVVSAEKDGYSPASQPGVTVFADSTQTVAVTLQKALKTIASVTSRSAGALVKPGTTADVYSVNAATLAKIGALGGGGALNSAYSAVASIPGAYVPLGQAGYFQTVHIRGGDYDQVGYELDGVPVNRSFDNYPSGALSSLGNQELQVYTGATPANSEGQGLAGYVNQVIKTGTYPGFADLSLGVGTPTFYHKLALEVGGATPNRNFSYYLGIGGYNQDFRFVDNQNAASYGQFGTALTQLTAPAAGPTSCADPLTPYSSCYANGAAGPGGYTVAPYQWGQLANISDRDVIANVHFALPHKRDGGKDDVQLLFDSGSLLNGYYSSLNDAGGPSQFPQNSNNPGPPVYIDGYQWSGPVGTFLPNNYQSLVSTYLFPSSPSKRSTFANIPADGRDTTWNDQEIVKLQYQKNIGTDAYFRIYGYTYYSDWLQYGPESTFANYASPTSPDYELSSHTRGVSASFADQINAKNLINLQASYTSANSVRDNNTQMLNGFGPGKRSNFAVAVDPNNPLSGICYQTNDANGNPMAVAVATSCNNQGRTPPATWTTWATAAAGAIPDISASTCGSGPCKFLVAENGLYATYNAVRPVFTAFSATDEFRPTSKLLLNLGVRLDRFQFNGANTVTDPARQFFFTAYNLDNCIFTATGAPVDKTTLGLAPTSSCPSGYTAANLQNTPSQVLSYNVFQPRIGGTYTFNPDSVLRFSYGKYVEPPNTAYEQYSTLQENLPALLGGSFYKFGFTTPGHEVRPPISYNTDISFEHHFKGTDWSFTFTPFLRKTRDQIQNFFLDQATGFVSGLNVGKQTSRGFEFQLNKGDFSRNGLSGQLSFAYTNSYINYGTLANGTTVVSQINNDIKNYNAYTKGCATGAASASLCGSTSSGAAAAACFTTAGAPDPACAAGDIGNPYWNAPVQGTLDPGANYAVYDIFPGGIGGSANSFTAPYVGTLILNYKRDKWAFTPTLQFQAGNRYGSPETTPGIDPATGGCGTLPAVAGDPRYPYGNPGPNAYNAVTCGATLNAIPNNFTGQFDQPGAFRNPSQILANLQISYEASPKITITGTFANLISRCFGGQREAWTVDNPNVCSYSIINNAGAFPPVGNVYNPGAPIQRLVQYPYGAYLGATNIDSNSTASAGSKAPFNFYLDAKIKI